MNDHHSHPVTLSASQFVQEFQSDVARVSDAIAEYDAWLPSPFDDGILEPQRFAPSVLLEARALLGLTSVGVERIQSLGEALNTWLAEEGGAMRAAWHDAKLRAVGSSHREKKLVAAKHLVADDFRDDAAIAALLESLSIDDETLALVFGQAAADAIDPSQRPDVVTLLADEIEAYERRASERAAFFASTLALLFEGHAQAVPSIELLQQLISRLLNTTGGSSFAAVSELVALAIQRSNDLASIRTMLRPGSGRELVFALFVIKTLDATSLVSATRVELTQIIREIQERSRDSGSLAGVSEHDQKWLNATARSLLVELQS